MVISFPSVYTAAKPTPDSLCSPIRVCRIPHSRRSLAKHNGRPPRKSHGLGGPYVGPADFSRSCAEVAPNTAQNQAQTDKEDNAAEQTADEPGHGPVPAPHVADADRAGPDQATATKAHRERTRYPKATQVAAAISLVVTLT